MTLNDAILAATGGPTVNDGLRAYYNAQGVPYGSLDDMERAFLRIQMPVATGTTNDLWMQYLSGTFGYTGTLNDMLLQYWSALAVTTFGPNVAIPNDPIVFTQPASRHRWNNVLVVGEQYQVTCTVDITAPNGFVRVKSGNDVIQTITVDGVYQFTFLATSKNFIVRGRNATVTDYQCRKLL